MRSVISYFKNNKGFSLIELIFVILIAGAIILVLSNLPNSISLIGTSRYESKAKDIAVSQLENIRNIPYSSLSDGSTNITDPRLSELPSSTGTILVELCPVNICTNDEEMRQVTVTVTWTEKNKEQKVELVTLVTEGGLQ